MVYMNAATADTASAEPRRNILVRIWDGLVAMGEARAMGHQFQYLSSLSDDQLERLGITRDGIARYVFRHHVI